MIDCDHFQVVEETIRFLVRNFKSQPSLEETALQVAVSPFHLQRIFTEWAGISPKKFLQYLTVEALKRELTQTENLMQAADNVGLSAQSRVYDLFVGLEAVTPGEFKARGKGMVIEYGIHPTPFGNCFIAATGRGICAMSFVNTESGNALYELQEQWEWADFLENPINTGRLAGQIFHPQESGLTFRLLVRGTPFQVKVWEALLKIPFGSVASYRSIARAAGYPGATRAVGTAIAHNPVAFLIPCHRIIRSEGIIGNYRWNPVRKTAMIGWEKAMKMSNEQ
jgi:AraC family transcriptional regulator, regulatory protein of adaptative response / methylated-DNA-[protein]-cysteine methyltransferase